jgi:hypothetical protein
VGPKAAKEPKRAPTYDKILPLLPRAGEDIVREIMLGRE